MAPRLIPVIAILFLGFMILGPLIVLIPMADQNFLLSDSDWSALKFTIFQATCSSFLSVLIGWPLARALARHAISTTSGIEQTAAMQPPCSIPTMIRGWCLTT